jgi:hypothetical protein
VSEAKRPNALEEENAELKKLLAKQCSMSQHSRGFCQKMVGPYPSGVGRRRGLVSMTEQSGVFLVHADELHCLSVVLRLRL